MIIKSMLGLMGCVAVATLMGFYIIYGHPILGGIFAVLGYRAVYNIVRVRD